MVMTTSMIKTKVKMKTTVGQILPMPASYSVYDL